MNKTLLSLLVLAALTAAPARADEAANSFALTLEPLMADTEHPSGDRSERHRPRFGIELAHTLWSNLELIAGAGIHRVRIKDSGSDTTLNFYDLRLGARQYFSRRQIGHWSPYLGLTVSEAWFRDADSTTGGNRRYTGYNASFGVGKRLSENTELRGWLGYSRLNAKDKLGDHSDTFATADLGLAAAIRF